MQFGAAHKLAASLANGSNKLKYSPAEMQNTLLNFTVQHARADNLIGRQNIRMNNNSRIQTLQIKPLTTEGLSARRPHSTLLNSSANRRGLQRAKCAVQKLQQQQKTCAYSHTEMHVILLLSLPLWGRQAENGFGNCTAFG